MCHRENAEKAGKTASPTVSKRSVELEAERKQLAAGIKKLEAGVKKLEADRKQFAAERKQSAERSLAADANNGDSGGGDAATSSGDNADLEAARLQAKDQLRELEETSEFVRSFMPDYAGMVAVAKARVQTTLDARRSAKPLKV